MMKGIKKCKSCGFKIHETDKAVMLMTFIGNKTMEKVFWHFTCYLKWLEESLDIKAKQLFNDTMRKTMEMFMGVVKNVQ